MEFEDVNTKIDWEVRRVAAALGVDELESEGEDEDGLIFMADQGPLSLGLRLTRDDGELLLLWIGGQGKPGAACISFRLSNAWAPEEKYCSPIPQYNPPLARAFYRLGFEDEDILEKLNYPLSTHEKLELRLSMPREFWPKKWLEEEAE